MGTGPRSGECSSLLMVRPPTPLLPWEEWDTGLTWHGSWEVETVASVFGRRKSRFFLFFSGTLEDVDEDGVTLFESFSAWHLAETSNRAEAMASLFSLSSSDPSVARVATVLSSCFVAVDRSPLSALVGVSNVGMDRLILPVAVIQLFVFRGVTMPAAR